MKLRRVVLIVAGAAVIAVAVTLLFFNGATKDYRDCVALMWDRKHPDAVKQRQREADLRECEADRLRYGWDCDCNTTLCGIGLIPPAENSKNPCEHLSLEELRRADAEASRDKPPR
jgi:hypothetical protein